MDKKREVRFGTIALITTVLAVCSLVLIFFAEHSARKHDREMNQREGLSLLSLNHYKS